jgi:hypothetical protein
MNDSPPRKRRGWIEALVATALSWNERLGRPVGTDDTPPAGKHPGQPADRGPKRRFRSASPESGPHRA